MLIEKCNLRVRAVLEVSGLFIFPCNSFFMPRVSSFCRLKLLNLFTSFTSSDVERGKKNKKQTRFAFLSIAKNAFSDFKRRFHFEPIMEKNLRDQKFGCQMASAPPGEREPFVAPTLFNNNPQGRKVY